MKETISDRLKHFFHVVSNVRPIVWIGTYVAITPIFALIYWVLPDGQFRIPDGASTDFGSWLYYSIVTITTLGFGDYTPAHGWAQAVTAVEVMCGLIFLGLFLNAVGSMKSEIDVESEIEKQKRVREAEEKDMLLKNIPVILHGINTFMAYCYAVTTPANVRNSASDLKYNPNFTIADMADMFKPSDLPFDNSRLPAVERLLQSASRLSISLDSLQNRVNLVQWPDLLEDSFSFVANFQMFTSTEMLTSPARTFITDEISSTNTDNENHLTELIKNLQQGLDNHINPKLNSINELYHFIKENAAIATKLETALTMIAAEG